MSKQPVRELLAAARRAPDDDAPRLVLADWYEESGDTDRARFIRSQLERAALPRWDLRQVTMELDERAILADHEATWRAELPAIEGVRYGRFERGAIARVDLDSATILAAHAEDILDACPGAEIVMRWPRLTTGPDLGAIEGLRALTIVGTLLRLEDIIWLAEEDLLSTVTDLTLFESRLDDEALGVLLESSHIGRLRTLRLPYHHLGDEGLEAFRSVSMPELVELDLSVETQDEIGSGGRDEPYVTSDGVMALCAWESMQGLRTLSLSGNQIGELGLIAALASPNTAHLETLRIRSVSDWDWEEEARPDVLEAFQHAPRDRRLVELDVGENELTDESSYELTHAAILSELKILGLDLYSSQDGAHLKVLQAPWLASVRVLSLRDVDLSTLKAVLDRALPELHTLRCTSSFYWSNMQGVSDALAAAPAQPSLRSLDLRGCNLDDDALATLGLVETLPALLALEIGANPEALYADEAPPFSPEGLRAFLDSPLGAQLRSVATGVPDLERLPAPERLIMRGEGHGHG